MVQKVNIKVLLPLTNWDDARSLALSPDGKLLALNLVYLHTSTNLTRIDANRSQLRVVTMDTFDAVYTQDFPTFELLTVGMGSLTWNPEGQIEQLRVAGLVGPGKSLIERFPLEQGDLTPILSIETLEDVVTRAVWQKGRWMALAAESGLWVLDTQPSPAGGPGAISAPFLVSEEPVLDLDWK